MQFIHRNQAIILTIDPAIRFRLLNGLDDIGITLTRAADIERYEADREREGPVTTAIP
jgi:3-isopropylmalate/(R)-2-methylmalate dehydratase small subunit